jgi:hypothetical protein
MRGVHPLTQMMDETRQPASDRSPEQTHDGYWPQVVVCWTSALHLSPARGCIRMRCEHPARSAGTCRFRTFGWQHSIVNNAPRREEGESSIESVRGVQPTFHVAQEMGALLGRSHNLQQSVQPPPFTQKLMTATSNALIKTDRALQAVPMM